MNTTISHCPVCGMDPNPLIKNIIYHRQSFYFCSQQCYDNFLDRPLLYSTGKPKVASIKQRTILLQQAPDKATCQKISDQLLRLMGIQSVTITNKNIVICYDLLHVTALQIEQALLQIEAVLEMKWYHQLQRGWIHYIEEIELDNLAAPIPPCCNQPPVKSFNKKITKE